jgi:hypothetical protein
MFIVGLFSWWYGTGWFQCVARVRGNLMSVYDYFSFDLLLRTLFAPFRQISAGKVRGPLGVQMRAFFDRLISRVIGGIIRTTVLIFGSITLCIAVLIGVLRLVIWPLIPALPIVFIVLAMSGWVPWKI